jgi:hypothetical protein
VLIFVDVIVQCVTLTIYARLCCFSWQWGNNPTAIPSQKKKFLLIITC